MEDRARYAAVGAFVIVLGLGAVALGLWLGFAQERKRYDTYAVYMGESVAGVKVGSAVKFSGVDVGRVRYLAVDPEEPTRVQMLLDIEQEVPIRNDTVAVLASLGVTGIAYVNLTGGSRDAPRLTAPSPGERYPVIESGPSLLLRMDTAVSALLVEMREASIQLKLVARDVSRVLATDNVVAVGEILRNVRVLTGELAGHTSLLTDSAQNMSRMAAGAAAAGAEVPQLMRRIGALLDALQQSSGAITAAAANVERLAGEARSELRTSAVDVLPEVASALREIRQLGETLNRLGRELERDPSVLVRGRPTLRRGPGE